MSKQKPKKKKRSISLFNPGDVIVFNKDNKHYLELNPRDKEKYYGCLFKEGSWIPKLFVYVCQINDPEGFDSGHHLMVDLKTAENHVMRHTSDFRKATWEEI